MLDDTRNMAKPGPAVVVMMDYCSFRASWTGDGRVLSAVAAENIGNGWCILRFAFLFLLPS